MQNEPNLIHLIWVRGIFRTEIETCTCTKKQTSRIKIIVTMHEHLKRLVVWSSPEIVCIACNRAVETNNRSFPFSHTTVFDKTTVYTKQTLRIKPCRQMERNSHLTKSAPHEHLRRLVVWESPEIVCIACNRGAETNNRSFRIWRAVFDSEWVWDASAFLRERDALSRA